MSWLIIIAAAIRARKRRDLTLWQAVMPWYFVGLIVYGGPLLFSGYATDVVLLSLAVQAGWTWVVIMGLAWLNRATARKPKPDNEAHSTSSAGQQTTSIAEDSPSDEALASVRTKTQHLTNSPSTPEPNPPGSDANNAEEGADAMKTCPFCAETIKAAAIVCRYCGRDLAQT